MQSILSIQSHVVYGYVGNKASTYPLQSMGYDVLPVNTVQFSNHTGYGKWQGEIFDSKHILKLIEGIFEIEAHKNCIAILTGYMGSQEICEVVKAIVEKFKNFNSNILYLCDPVIGNNNCYVKPEVLSFFTEQLFADIITPNQYEAETLLNDKIHNEIDLKRLAKNFHNKGIGIVIITSVKFINDKNLYIFGSNNNEQILIKVKDHIFDQQVNGTGDLFSSIFLGKYIKTYSLSLALQTAVFYLQQVLINTIKSNTRELQVLSMKYNESNDAKLPEFIKLSY